MAVLGGGEGQDSAEAVEMGQCHWGLLLVPLSPEPHCARDKLPLTQKRMGKNRTAMTGAVVSSHTICVGGMCHTNGSISQTVAPINLLCA